MATVPRSGVGSRENLKCCSKLVEDPSRDSSPFSKLPEELLTRIFSYLTKVELCRSVAPVCRTWLRHAYDPVFWSRRLDVVFNPLSDQWPIYMRRSAGMLKALTLTDRVLTMEQMNDLPRDPRNRADFIQPSGKEATDNDLITRHLSDCPNLVELNFQFDWCFPQFVTQDLIKNIARECPQLCSLSFGGCELNDQSAAAEFSSLRKLTRLTFVVRKLRHNSVMNITKLVASVAPDSLQDFSLDISEITKDQYPLMVKAIISNHAKSLKALRLSNRLEDTSIKIISSCHLEKLDFMGSENLSDTSLQYIQTMGHLRYLSMYCCHPTKLSVKAVEAMFTQTPVTVHLTTLLLYGFDQLNDSILYQLARHCRRLRILYITPGREVTDQGLSHIVENLGLMESMDLEYFELVEGKCLLSIPTKMTRLRNLCVGGCDKIKESLLCEIIKEKQDLDISTLVANSTIDYRWHGTGIRRMEWDGLLETCSYL